MESHEHTEPNPLEDLQEIINGFPAGLEHEYSTTENPWWACFGTCVAVVSLRLELIRPRLTAEQYQRGREYVEELNGVMDDLKARYPGKADIPPPGEQATLFAKFEMFYTL
jgi:hypothetical protein